MPSFSVRARPFEFEAPLERTALLIVDMQNDFCNPGGYLAFYGVDVSPLRRAIGPNQQVLEAARRVGMMVVFTRESHRPDLSDLHPAKQAKSARFGIAIGEPGPLGRIMIRGSKSNEIIDELRPQPAEVVIDKCGKGAFYGTDLEIVLRNRGITHLLVTGVTTNVCVQSTVREAADRSFWVLVLEDACAALTPDLHKNSLDMITYQGIFGQVASSEGFLRGLGV